MTTVASQAGANGEPTIWDWSISESVPVASSQNSSGANSPSSSSFSAEAFERLKQSESFCAGLADACSYSEHTFDELTLMNPKKLRACTSASFLWLAIGLLTAACGSSQVAIEPAETPTPSADTQAIAAEPAGDREAVVVPTPEVDPADAYVEDNDYDTSEIDPADACSLNECEFSVSPSPLSSDEINRITDEIRLDEKVLSNQSFAITLPYIGSADFLAIENSNNRLFLRLRTDRNEYQNIYESDWTLWDVKAVSFEDIHQDGDGPDIIVIAEYITGIGPEGADPFSVATVFFNRGDDTFQEDAAVNQILSDRKASTINEVIEIAQTEELVRGLQYREGP
ncbi:MAG: hypothetical protein AAGN15_26280 [Cyanobacteria bacterium J06581_3]